MMKDQADTQDKTSFEEELFCERKSSPGGSMSVAEKNGEALNVKKEVKGGRGGFRSMSVSMGEEEEGLGGERDGSFVVGDEEGEGQGTRAKWSKAGVAYVRAVSR